MEEQTKDYLRSEAEKLKDKIRSCDRWIEGTEKQLQEKREVRDELQCDLNAILLDLSDK